MLRTALSFGTALSSFSPQLGCKSSLSQHWWLPCPAQGRRARAMSPLPRGLHPVSRHQGPSSSPPLPSAPASSLATCQACHLGSRLALTGPHAITNTTRLCPCHSCPLQDTCPPLSFPPHLLLTCCSQPAAVPASAQTAPSLPAN